MKMGFEKKKRVCLVAMMGLVGLLLSGCDIKGQPMRGSISVDSTPRDASLYINGLFRGETPSTIVDLNSGQYLVEMRKEGYERVYEQVTLLEGQNREVSKELNPVEGLLLVESNPEGADIIINGISKGFTPLLIADLPLGTYQIELKSADLLPKTVEVNLADRTPQGVFVTLNSNTARVVFTSVPDGAAVRLDGVLAGETPLTVEAVKPGKVQIKITKAGYRVYERTMMLEAMKRYEVGAQLEALPSGLTITSEPKGAELMVNNKSVGVAPVVLSNLKEGPHEVIASMIGYATEMKTVYLEPNINESIEFVLQKDSGELVFDTEPANVQVFVDGELALVTEPNGGSDVISMPVTLTLKSDREHVVQFIREGFVSQKITIQSLVDQVTTKHIILKRIFVYDTKIVTADGVIKCRLEDRLPNGDLYYERFPGVYDSTRASEILEVIPISLDDVANRGARRMFEQHKAPASFQ